MKYLENFDHWSDSKKLTDFNDVTGALEDEDDLIKVDEDNVEWIPEIEHLLTKQDVEKIKDHFKKYGNTSFFEGFDIEKYLGRSLKQFASLLDPYNCTENLIEFLLAIFPNKFTHNQ